MHEGPTVHVFFGPDHEVAAFINKNLIDGDGVLSYCRGAVDRKGEPIPDGWALFFGTKDAVNRWFIGLSDTNDLETAVSEAKRYLRQYRRWS